jgi:hypothetical protein
MTELAVEFAGEWFRPDPASVFEIGREGDLELDDNPYLHRRFLQITCSGGLWWLGNVGARLSVTVCDAAGGVQSWLSPGNSLPIVFPSTSIVFTAGPTTYELLARLEPAPYAEIRTEEPDGGATTIGLIPFTTSQRQLVVALCEPMLRRDGTGVSEIPSSADAAARLGWTTTRFNRKLDNVCEKLDRVGVKGLRGGSGNGLATNRRARLVEYAVASRLVSAEDLPLLDAGEEDE